MLEKLQIVKQRFDEVSDLIIQPDIMTDQKRYIELNKEYKDLRLLMNKRDEYLELTNNLQEAEEILATGKLLGILQENPDMWLGYGRSKSLDSKTIGDLINNRNEARRDKNFTLADSIRDKLKNKGIVIEDTKDGTIWRSIE